MPTDVLAPEDLAALAAMQSFIDEYAALLDGPAASPAAPAGLCVDRDVGDGAAAKKKAPAKRRPRASKRSSRRSIDCASPPAGEPPHVPAPMPALLPLEDARGLQAPKPRAKYNYNPNRARDGERRELTELRGQVDELTQELEALEEARRACDQCLGRGRSTRRRSSKRRSQGEKAAAHESVELPRDRARAAEVWKEIANDQFQLHMRAVRENRRLKRVVEGHREVTDGLKRLLEQRTASEPVKLFETAPRAWPMMALVPDLSDKEIYQELLNGLDPSYREAEDIFLRSGLSESDVGGGSHTQMHEDTSGNLFAQIFAHKIFPFDVRTTGLVCWKIFSFCVRPNCTSFFSQLGAENVEESDDTVAESFGIEFREQGSTALFRGKQIKRMYIEEDRVVIVWHAFVNPIEFDGRPLAGAAFRERGYFIVKRPSNVAPDATFALLQSCYVLTPNVPVRTLPQDSVAGALVSFVLNCMAASVPENHQIIENSLFDEQMERHMQRGHHCS